MSKAACELSKNYPNEQPPMPLSSLFLMPLIFSEAYSLKRDNALAFGRKKIYLMTFAQCGLIKKKRLPAPTISV